MGMGMTSWSGWGGGGDGCHGDGVAMGMKEMWECGGDWDEFFAVSYSIKQLHTWDFSAGKLTSVTKHWANGILVLPIPEYSSTIWDLHTSTAIKKFEVQMRAAGIT